MCLSYSNTQSLMEQTEAFHGGAHTRCAHVRRQGLLQLTILLGYLRIQKNTELHPEENMAWKDRPDDGMSGSIAYTSRNEHPLATSVK